jgi:serine/threonine-protein kinase HipA
VAPFFAGLLPEGRRLSSLRRAVKTSADDELSLLLAVGRDPIGDAQVVPEGEVPTAAEAMVTVDRSFTEIRFADLLADAGIIDQVALPGVQEKVSARVISVPVGRADHRYILKLDPPEYPHVVVNEAYFLGVARDSGMPVADTEVVYDTTGRPGLLVRRFDRVVLADGTIMPLACEDACQLLDRWPADKYNVSSEAVTAAVAAVCAAGTVAARDVFRQMCFAWVTGNGDVHAKNISVIAGPDGEYRVAPTYDLPSTLPYGDRSLALSLAGKTKGLSRRQLLEFASTVGLTEKAATRVVDATLTATAAVIDELDGGALPFNRATIRATIRELKFRRQQLTH